MIKFIDNLLSYEAYSLKDKEKSGLFLSLMSELTLLHYGKCNNYANILQALNEDLSFQKLEDIPFIPASVFKNHNMLSISKKDIFKTMHSSGTTGQEVSKIYLDKYTASMQTKVLSKLMQNLLGDKRLPMLIIDSPKVLKDRNAFSARGAGILGFSLYGRNITYALDEKYNLRLEEIKNFIEIHKEKKIFIFGFTYIIWIYFIEKLIKNKIQCDLSNATLLHGGGWKNLKDIEIDNRKYKSVLKRYCNLSNVVNYYGMVEQTGSLYFECDCGYLTTPIYSDIIIRDPNTLKELPHGKEGIIQTMSMIPFSYPGHSILTEDIGILRGIDNCRCKRNGKYFEVLGRIPKAEVRGCSDTHRS